MERLNPIYQSFADIYTALSGKQSLNIKLKAKEKKLCLSKAEVYANKVLANLSEPNYNVVLSGMFASFSDIF